MSVSFFSWICPHGSFILKHFDVRTPLHSKKYQGLPKSFCSCGLTEILVKHKNTQAQMPLTIREVMLSHACSLQKILFAHLWENERGKYLSIMKIVLTLQMSWKGGKDTHRSLDHTLRITFYSVGKLPYSPAEVRRSVSSPQRAWPVCCRGHCG